MELGGKCPAIVLDDANLEQAAELCAKGALMNHGQICFSTERIIVHKKVAADFKKHVVEAFKKNSPIAGSGVTDGIVAHAHEVLLDAQKHGAEFLVGGPEYVNGDSKASLKPSLIFQPNKDARIRDEETFGPSASLYEVSSDEEAIDVANDSSYGKASPVRHFCKYSLSSGLNACVHTTNMERGLKMAKELEYGQVHINSISVYTAATGPQGGVKGAYLCSDIVASHRLTLRRFWVGTSKYDVRSRGVLPDKVCELSWRVGGQSIITLVSITCTVARDESRLMLDGYLTSYSRKF